MADKKGIGFLSVIPLRAEASDSSEMVSQILFGESYHVLDESEKWLKVRMDSDHYEGFIDRKQYMSLDDQTAEEYRTEEVLLVTDDFKTEIQDFGILHLSPGSIVPAAWIQGHERFTRPFEIAFSLDRLISDARKFLGTPYLWGGRSVFGIDCSGLMQVLFRLNGISIPRDAWQQAQKGEEIDFGKRRAGDMAFFQNEKGRITHVGLITNEADILHASGWVKENELTEQGIVDEKGAISHIFHSIRRLGK